MGSSRDNETAGEPMCPRCDYCLRGLETSRCPECGLEFNWDDVRTAARAKEAFFVEYRGKDAPLRALTHTWWQAVHIRRFWRWIQLTWPVRVPTIIVLGVGILLTTILLQALVCTGLNVITSYWFHGRNPSWAGRLTSLVPYYARGTLMGTVPPLIVAVMLCALRQTVARHRINTGHMLRLAVYSSAAFLLLPVARCGRLLCPLLLYHFDNRKDWDIAFWWLLPDGQWSQRVYSHGLEFSWFDRPMYWPEMLGSVTMAAILLIAVAIVIRKQSIEAKFTNRMARVLWWIGVLGLIAMWPVAMVYVLWIASLSVGASEYLWLKRGWSVGLVAGFVGLASVLMLDWFLHGGSLLVEMLCRLAS